MRVIVRGIPNFAFVQIHEVPDINTFTQGFELTVMERVFEVEGQYRTPERKRVSLYVEGVEENREVLLSRCILGSGSLSTCYLQLNDQGNMSVFGTDSMIRTGRGRWYMADPRLDPRWSVVLGEHKVRREAQARELARIEEGLETMRTKVETLVDQLGYEEAIRRLEGGST